MAIALSFTAHPEPAGPATRSHPDIGLIVDVKDNYVSGGAPSPIHLTLENRVSFRPMTSFAVIRNAQVGSPQFPFASPGSPSA